MGQSELNFERGILEYPEIFKKIILFKLCNKKVEKYEQEGKK